MQSVPTYLTLSPHCSLRLLEKPCIYDRARDELYELDEHASAFVQSLPLPTSEPKVDQADTEFLTYCFDEGIFSLTTKYPPAKKATQSPIPSLRYLLLHITTRCNLKCAHCFLGDPNPQDLPFEQIVKVMDEFDGLQGLRLLISGGEPLLHPRFWAINELFERFSFRTVILSNGTMFVDPPAVERLRAQEVQVSLDGIGDSHEALRGRGTYSKTLRGIENLVQCGVDVSIATMVHAGNIREFDRLEEIVRNVGAKEWNIDVPSRAGRWKHSPTEFGVEQLGSVLTKGFGGGSHHSADGDWACGAHLCAVMANGNICKCGFYQNSPVGNITDGLANGWRNIPRTKLGQLRCDCEILQDCRGGCRYRAEVTGDKFGRDPIMCAANGLPPEPLEGGDLQ